MSNIYIQEPSTKGKVCVKTSVGEIEIELWSKECPKAARNFVQLCMEGYYDGTIFHRLVKGFIVQGGDPTGTGMGGDSIYGHNFKDEFHSRLRFVRRGLVAMANAGKHDNGSQFFFTLDKTPELQGKHTLFGKVVGDTLYNMIKLAESDVDSNDRPVAPHKIIRTEVVDNPFPDIIPRAKPKKREKEKKKEAKGTKNYNLLSFGDEAEEDEDDLITANKTFAGKAKSAHDMAKDEKLSAQPAVDKGEIGDAPEEEEEDDEESKLRRRHKIAQKLGKRTDLEWVEAGKEEEEIEEEEDLEEIYNSESTKEERAQMKKLKEEFRQMSKELIRMRRGPKQKKDDEEEDVSPAVAEFRALRKRYLEAKQAMQPRKTKDREAQTMEMLEKFNERLKSASRAGILKDQPAKQKSTLPELPKEPEPEPKGEEKEENTQHLDEEDLEGDEWLSHRFQADEEGLKSAKDANVDQEDWFDISDPRHYLNKRRREGVVEEEMKRVKRD